MSVRYCGPYRWALTSGAAEPFFSSAWPPARERRFGHALAHAARRLAAAALKLGMQAGPAPARCRRTAARPWCRKVVVQRRPGHLQLLGHVHHRGGFEAARGKGAAPRSTMRPRSAARLATMRSLAMGGSTGVVVSGRGPACVGSLSGIGRVQKASDDVGGDCRHVGGRRRLRHAARRSRSCCPPRTHRPNADRRQHHVGPCLGIAKRRHVGQQFFLGAQHRRVMAFGLAQPPGADGGCPDSASLRSISQPEAPPPHQPCAPKRVALPRRRRQRPFRAPARRRLAEIAWRSARSPAPPCPRRRSAAAAAPAAATVRRIRR